MPSTEIQKGEVARAVATNVRTVRELRRLQQQQLSARLSELGRPIPPTALSKLEDGKRRVDVDDLIALAVALNVSPARLLLPDVGEDDSIALTPKVARPAWAVWQWTEGQYALPLEDGSIDDEADMALQDVRPTWKRREYDHPLTVAVRRVAGNVTQVLRNVRRQEKGVAALKRWVEVTQGDVRRLQDELEQVVREAADRG